MKKIGVVGLSEKWSSEVLVDSIEKATGFRLLINMEEVIFDMQSGEVKYRDIDLCSLDAIIIKKISPEYTPMILDRLEILRFLADKANVRIFSHPAKIMRLLNRLSCTVALRAGDIPMPPTVITEDVDEAFSTLEKFGKAVFKPLYTSKARGMILLEYNDSALEKIKEYKASNTVIYMQKVVKHPGYDLGITFIGGEYLATYARVGNKESWNTTVREGGYYQKYEPCEEMIELAKRAQAIFDMDFTCVDMVETPDGPMVYEVSAFGGFKGLLKANNIDAAGRYVEYVLEKLNA